MNLWQYHAGSVTYILHACYMFSEIFDHYTDPEFCKGLELRPEPNADRIKDIYDGSEYSKLCEPGSFLCKELNPANLSFTINTDGVALFKSSSTSIWPIFLAINELPPHLRYALGNCICIISEWFWHILSICRYSKKHLILAGLWHAKQKPFMLTFLRPVVDQLNYLYKEG